MNIVRRALRAIGIGARKGAAAHRLRARFDAAQSNAENARHWSAADGLSANTAASPGVRRTLRNRARYEAANNSYARGMVNTLAADAIGTGPRLQMSAETINRKDAAFVEGEFIAWAMACDLPEKLRTARMARTVDGECFGLLTTNATLPTPVKLDLRLVEADQVASRDFATLSEANAVDGIRFDAAGNPVSYDVLDQHPGSGLSLGFGQAKTWDAESVLHLFIPERPGQRRGIPEMTSALPLFAQLRRWTLSVIAAAEVASDFAAVMFTEQSATGDEPEAADAFERLEIERRALMTLPAGWKMEQFKAEQPVSTYADFKKEILGEIARCLSIPFNVAAGNSADHNYASGRLDWQTYARSVKVDRSRIVAQWLDRIFAAWVREAVLVEDYLPQSLRSVDTDWSHVWIWDGSEHVDPLKEANAQAARLSSLTTTLSDEWAARGFDWEEKAAQIAREHAKLRELGLPIPGQPVAVPAEGDDFEDAPPPATASRQPAAPAPRKRARGDLLVARDAGGRLVGIGSARIQRDDRGRILGLVS